MADVDNAGPTAAGPAAEPSAEPFAAPPATLDELRERHRKEARALQNEITRLKKTATKGDKKKKKDVQTEIDRLEADLLARHQAELTAFETPAVDAPEEQQPESDDAGPSARRPTKAQKRRERKEQELNQIREEAAAEAANGPNLSRDETERLGRLLNALNLRIHDVPSNGDCLFSAVADQLRVHADSATPDTQALRRAAAEWMWAHRDDFLPFMTRDDGDMMTEDEFRAYCTTMETTAAWGGQPEINALSGYLQRAINVFQASGPPLRTGAEYESRGPPLLLSYHRHLYALGAHYNSLRPKGAAGGAAETQEHEPVQEGGVAEGDAAG